MTVSTTVGFIHKKVDKLCRIQVGLVKMDRKFTIITGHGKLEFTKMANGRLEMTNVNGIALSFADRIRVQSRLGKMEVQEQKDEG